MVEPRRGGRRRCRDDPPATGPLGGGGQIDRQLGSARGVQVSCAKLIRVDFIAAGDLLNWVLAKQAEQRSVSFIDAHRLLALFFGAMGLDEHAKVSIPRD